MITVTCCTSKPKHSRIKSLGGRWAALDVWRDCTGWPARALLQNSTPGDKGNDNQKCTPGYKGSLYLVLCCPWVQMPSALPWSFNQDVPFSGIRGMQILHLLLCPLFQIMTPKGAGTLTCSLSHACCLAQCQAQRTRFEKVCEMEEWMQCPPLGPLFTGPSFGPFFGMGPCSLQVSPKSSCPYVSFSSWKRKFVLKAALLFLLLVIPGWMGLICLLAWLVCTQHVFVLCNISFQTNCGLV